jgi:hypothetical protein
MFLPEIDAGFRSNPIAKLPEQPGLRIAAQSRFALLSVV